MKKRLTLLCALLSLLLQSAAAAPIGWYNLTETWRDGSFVGRFFYDSTAPVAITQITGTLIDIAQVTAIDTVWSGERPPGASWIFVNNALPTDLDAYDAGFYLNLVDQGSSLTLDTGADNGLYDWSSDFAFFTPEQLNGSPLIAFDISPVAQVPEPSTLALLVAGLLACLHCRHRKTFT